MLAHHKTINAKSFGMIWQSLIQLAVFSVSVSSQGSDSSSCSPPKYRFYSAEVSFVHSEPFLYLLALSYCPVEGVFLKNGFFSQIPLKDSFRGGFFRALSQRLGPSLVPTALNDTLSSEQDFSSSRRKRVMVLQSLSGLED